MTGPALLSPSGAHRWMRCPGSLRLEQTVPDRSSVFAEEGIRAHEVAAAVLLGDPEGAVFDDDAMAEHVGSYVRLVHEYAQGGSLLVEQRVFFGEWVGHDDAFGTSDAVIVHDDLLTVIDLKYGMGVKVDAVENEQLMLYALGALYEYEALGPFTDVRMVVHQPRLNWVSEWQVPVQELHAFAAKAKLAAEIALSDDAPFEPGEKQCRFCNAKAVCPALEKEVDLSVADDFRDMLAASTMPADRIALAMERVGMVEDWCKAIRAECERRLLAGQDVPGFKLVEGRKGDRRWTSEAEVEALFKSFRLRQDEMYDFKLISPTKAEKLLKTQTKRWAKAQELITRNDGKPSVAPVTDKRPALVVSTVEDDFRLLANTEG